jgi:hypothetical protein
MKTSPTILALLLSSSLTAQVFLGATGTNHGIGVQTGALIKDRLDLTAGFVTRVSQDISKPIMYYTHAGVKFPIGETESGFAFSVTPAIGYSITTWDEDGPVKSKRLFPHIEIAAERRNIRVFSTFTKSDFFYAAIGIKGYIVFDSDGPTRRKVY